MTDETCKIGMTMPVSDDMFGWLPPAYRQQAFTAEQQAAWDAEQELRRQDTERRAAEARVAQADFLAQLRNRANPLTRAVLELHSPTEDGWYANCDGCDYSGWEGEPPEWPCRTVSLIAERLDVTKPDYLS